VLAEVGTRDATRLGLAPMTLGDLLREAGLDLPRHPGGRGPAAVDPGRPVTAIEYDSRRVEPGAVFVAVKGQRVDGVRFAGEAVARGAVLIVAEAPPADEGWPWLTVPDARRALAALAAAFYRHPSRELVTVGITGTNGKTTTSYLVGAIFDHAGLPCGRIGTITYRVGAAERPAARTTPEAPDIQRLLREMVQAGSLACAMEVSSHALALARVEGTVFRAAVFTNLTRDHLDFHGTMERYFEAKRRLFDLLAPDGVAVVNVDDPYGAGLARALGRVVTFAVERAADVTVAPFTVSLDGLTLEVRTPRGVLPLRSRLVGRPNAYNILAAVAVATGLDLPASAIERGVAAVDAVPGRFQVVSTSADDVTVVVDYAHTDDALRNLLQTARPLALGRVITVFGCGGDRDRSKRPLMGAVAARWSDEVIVTSDNPRSEDPEAIIADIVRGIAAAASRTGAAQVRYATVVDRRAAIERAVREARPGDLILIAGKGHERVQEVGGRTLPFDDVAVARDALARRRKEVGHG
jgi:UDP-N-acetylmuramoyl-L-alanyl-D-glutamate--2,6-diaminopimelate ligase